MNPIQEYLILPPHSMTIPYAKTCPPPPRSRTSPMIASWSTVSTPVDKEVVFSWGAPPTWEMPPPQNRSGAASPGDKKATHSWSDLMLPAEPEGLRHLTIPIEPAILSSRQADDIIHPDIKHIIIRQRGSYWWEKSQAKLEHQFSCGKRQPVQGGFYVFLEEEQSGNIIRFGNILAGAYWVMQTVAFPKGHPDADIPPYQMIDVRE